MPLRPLGKSCEPATFEAEIYKFWNENGCFEAADANAEDQAAFCMVIPPPNVTGALHMGHALTNTIQDILVRWRRMRGDNTLWLPGTDHAGIATQAQVEKSIAREGKGPGGKPQSRHDLGREAFVKRVWEWKEEHGGQITNQLKRLGSSLDWKRERFTMDDGLSTAVREVFVRLYKEGLIYRGERIINWCPRCQTALSDLEVIPTERKGSFWHITYPIVDEGAKPVLNADGTPATLVIATTRPETLLGDTALAVHPEDDRYKHLHGKKAALPLLGRLIPIITDSYVDREFGSGALKVTPAHDFNDYDLGKRHNLPIVSVMGKDGKLTAAGGPYAGLKYTAAQGAQLSEARERVIQDLKDKGLLVKTEDHVNKIGLCQRCENIAEPIISKQWFVQIAPLAKPAIEAVENGAITFTPKAWEKTYFEWMRNIRDWCISRQLWWGHQIPAWYCGRCQEITVAMKAPSKCVHCSAPAAELKQDEDVLDTWFSSALWPFSTLGWPEKTKALATFYPTAILETGFDIIFFWVARMIMMGLHFMGDVPFRQVYLHAMVRDEKGEKMSKSKGNVIDPLVLIDQHGADALRFTLASMAGQGRDIKLAVDRVEGNRAFCNKLWNAVKFFHLQFEEANGGPVTEPEEGVARWIRGHRLGMHPVNRWIVSRLQKLATDVDSSLAAFALNDGAQALYEYAWLEYCDWYIEFSKVLLKVDEQTRLETLITQHYVLDKLLKLLHPFMPFVTEELWQSLPWKQAATTTARAHKHLPEAVTLMLQAFPDPEFALEDSDSVRTVTALKAIIEAVRNFRGENNISPRTEFPITYVPGSAAADVFVRTYAEDIKAMSRVSKLESLAREHLGDRSQLAEAVIPIANPPIELRISLKGLVDVEEETKRMRKEIDRVKGDIEFLRGKLSKDTFIAKAPPELVAKEKAREAELIAKLAELDAALKRLSKLATA